MKKLIFLALTTVLIFSGNSCRLIKHRQLDKKEETVKIQNDVQVSQQVQENFKAIDAYKFDKSKLTYNETISYKPAPKDDSIELTASFNIDTAKTLKGDTALTLVGPGVRLTITRNPHNNSLTANIKSHGKSQTIPVGELLINRKLTQENDLTDTTKILELHKDAKKDSLDKSLKQTELKTKNLKSDKEKAPSPIIWLGIAALVLVAIYLIFKK